MFEVDVKNVTEKRRGEGEDQLGFGVHILSVIATKWGKLKSECVMGWSKN